MLGMAGRLGTTTRSARVARRSKAGRGRPALLVAALILPAICMFPGGPGSAETMPAPGPATGSATGRATLVAIGVRPSTAATTAGPATTTTTTTTTSTRGSVFLSPSRNIGCEVDWQFTHLGAATLCQTLAPPESVTIAATGAIEKCSGVACVGHPAKSTPVLGYMASTTSGPFLCASRFDGVACSAGGRAFLISRSGIATYPVLPHTTMAIYGDPSGHPTLSAAKAFGWVVSVDRLGHNAEVFVECGRGSTGSLPRDQLWTVDLSAVHSFRVETNLANPAAGSVVEVAHDKWVNSVRVNGWDGYVSLGGNNSFVSDGPGTSACPS
jgi:hypothetical protein